MTQSASRLPLFTWISIFLLWSRPGFALELFKDDKRQLNADISAGIGVFHSDESYGLRDSEGSVNWDEGFYSLGLSGSVAFDTDGEIYSAVSDMGTGVGRDGDAAGYTTGSESRNELENAYLGWRSGDLFPSLGKNGVDVSGGRQVYAIGSGFLVQGDAVNFGKGFDDFEDAGLIPDSLNRGGAYYMAPRLAFDETAILKLGQQQWRGEFFWFKSDNKAQAKTEMAGTYLSYVNEHYGTAGVTWLHGLSVDDEYAEFLGYLDRDGMDTYSINFEGSAGVDKLSLSSELVGQDGGDEGDEYAWYADAGWHFSDAGWQPGVGVRYSSFSDHFDPLFYGFSSGYGTWFQGEVAGNYAGPFNSNADVWHLYLSAQPLKSLTLGALYFHFDSRKDSLGDLSGDEIDLYANWTINEHFTFSPLVGFYTPDKSADDGGPQVGNNDTNTYAQMTVMMSF